MNTGLHYYTILHRHRLTAASPVSVANNRQLSKSAAACHLLMSLHRHKCVVGQGLADYTGLISSQYTENMVLYVPSYLTQQASGDMCNVIKNNAFDQSIGTAGGTAFTLTRK